MAVGTGYLWVQQRTANGELSIKKIPRAQNSADLMTHHAKSGAEIDKVLAQMGYEVRQGSSKLELKAAIDSVASCEFNIDVLCCDIHHGQPVGTLFDTEDEPDYMYAEDDD